MKYNFWKNVDRVYYDLTRFYFTGDEREKEEVLTKMVIMLVFPLHSHQTSVIYKNNKYLLREITTDQRNPIFRLEDAAGRKFYQNYYVARGI